MNLLRELQYNYRRYFVAPRLDNVEWTECPYCAHKTVYDTEGLMGCFYCGRTIGPEGDPREYIERVEHWKQFAEAVGPEEIFGDEAEQVMKTFNNIIELYEDGYYRRAKKLNDIIVDIENADDPEVVAEKYDELRL